MAGGSEQINKIPGSLKEKRRIFERFQSRFPVKFKDTRNDFGADVYLQNFSAEGAGIFTREQLYLDDSVNLEVKLPDGKDPMTMRGEVVWTKKQDADGWDVGLKFYNAVFMNLWRIYKSAEAGSAI